MCSCSASGDTATLTLATASCESLIKKGLLNHSSGGLMTKIHCSCTRNWDRVTALSTWMICLGQQKEDEEQCSPISNSSHHHSRSKGNVVQQGSGRGLGKCLCESKITCPICLQKEGVPKGPSKGVPSPVQNCQNACTKARDDVGSPPRLHC